MTSPATAHPISTEQRFRVMQEYVNGPHGPMRSWASEPRQGLPILFIHGYGAMIDHWKRIVRPMARQHSFYAIDLYGFGESARPNGKPSKERWADQAATFVRDVIGEPAVIVGHSMGGVVATEFARRHADLTRALVLVNSSGMQLYERPMSQTDRFLMGMIGAPLLGEALAGVFANPWGVRQSLLSAYHNKERVTDDLVEMFSTPLRKYGSASYLAVSRNTPSIIIEARAGEITAPALLIWGAEDRSIPPSDAEALKKLALPQAEIKILPDTGHCPFDENPTQFCDALLPWLARL